VNDWSRIADPRGVDEISAPPDLRPRDSEDRTVIADAVLIAVRLDEITPPAARFFDLEKPEAGAISELFPGV
jgi:hypothetical protein